MHWNIKDSLLHTNLLLTFSLIAQLLPKWKKIRNHLQWNTSSFLQNIKLRKWCSISNVTDIANTTYLAVRSNTTVSGKLLFNDWVTNVTDQIVFYNNSIKQLRKFTHNELFTKVFQSPKNTRNAIKIITQSKKYVVLPKC